MMLAYLLARMGVDVVVLEKHADFLRDFRGDTIHPSTMEVMYELGILDDFLKRPHQKVRELAGQIGGESVMLADFSHLPVHCQYVAFMPQWEFLNFIAEKARKYPQFHLKMEAEVTALTEEGGRVTGVRAKTPQGVLEMRAALTICCALAMRRMPCRPLVAWASIWRYRMRWRRPTYWVRNFCRELWTGILCTRSSGARLFPPGPHSAAIDGAEQCHKARAGQHEAAIRSVAGEASELFALVTPDSRQADRAWLPA